MRYYAIPDLHGRFDLLEKARLTISEDSSDLPEGNFKIITLGDYIDRGPQSKEIIQSLKTTQELFPYMICLTGNHEDMCVKAYLSQDDRYFRSTELYMQNGGYATVQSYNDKAYYGEVNWIDDEHIKWMGSLPHFYQTAKQVFVHAGVPADDLELIEQPKEEMIWMLYGKNDAGGYRGQHVVHGHHQFADGPHTWHSSNGGRTDLDTFAWKTGRLAIGVFDDTQGPPIKILEVTDDEYRGADGGSEWERELSEA